MYWELVKLKYLKPAHSMYDEWPIKVGLAFVVGLIGKLQDIFSTNIELLILLIFAVVFDWITGQNAARRRGEDIISTGWRQTCTKVIEYTAFLLILIGVGNVFGEAEGHGWVMDVLAYLRHIDYFGFLFIIMTELKSIAENISGKKGKLSILYNHIHRKIFGEKLD